MSPNRAVHLRLGNKVIALPCFFPSVSSVKTAVPPVAYIGTLAAARHPLFLVSAYDIARDRARMDALVSKARSSGSVILMDSGNYESFWREDSTWTQSSFHDVAATTDASLAFSYDNQQPSGPPTAIADETVMRFRTDQSRSRSSIAPIIHASPHWLPDVVREVATRLCPSLIAVPERELGNGILERMQTIRRIRHHLDAALDYYCTLHLLGTGHPLSITAYALAGADSFDGLEWCRAVVDHDTGQLLHLHHWDLVRHQTRWGQRDGLRYLPSVLMHNLTFFQRFMATLHTRITRDHPWKLLTRFATEEQAAQMLQVITT